MTFHISEMLHYGSPFWVTEAGGGDLVVPASVTETMGATGTSLAGRHFPGNQIIVLGVQWDFTVTGQLQYNYDYDEDDAQEPVPIMSLTGQGALSPCFIPIPRGAYNENVTGNVQQQAKLSYTGTGRIWVMGIVSPGSWRVTMRESEFVGDRLGQGPVTLITT